VEGARLTWRDRSQRAAAGDSARDILALGKGEGSLGTAAYRWGDSTMTLQQKVNNHMVFANRTTNGMQRFSRLPTTPDLTSLRRRKRYAFSWDHKHHL
jgi:hypothetical protein